MANDDQLILAMPVGLPPAGTDPGAFFTALGNGQNLQAQVETGPPVVISVWTDPADDYSAVAPMIRSAVSYNTQTHTLTCKTWLWEYIMLRGAAGGSSTILPAQIKYANLDDIAVRTAVQTEITANETYANMTEQERVDAVAAFMDGTGRLVAQAGTRLGMGAPDQTQNGMRRVDITLMDADGNALDPAFYFSLWDSIGGSLVKGHPLIEQVQGPISPAIIPVEGSIRVKITGDNLTADTPVLVGGTAVTNVRVTPDGVLYADVPARVSPDAAAGRADLKVGNEIYPGAVAFTEELGATAQATVVSHFLRVAEITMLAADPTLDDEARGALHWELDAIGYELAGALSLRRLNSNEDAYDKTTRDALNGAVALLIPAYEKATAALGA